MKRLTGRLLNGGYGLNCVSFPRAARLPCGLFDFEDRFCSSVEIVSVDANRKGLEVCLLMCGSVKIAFVEAKKILKKGLGLL